MVVKRRHSHVASQEGWGGRQIGESTQAHQLCTLWAMKRPWNIKLHSQCRIKTEEALVHSENITKTDSEFIIKRLQCALPQLHCSCSCRLQLLLIQNCHRFTYLKVGLWCDHFVFVRNTLQSFRQSEGSLPTFNWAKGLKISKGVFPELPKLNNF